MKTLRESTLQTSGAQRAPIRLLSPTLINQIAAGEVIVRPASVVKELVENAFDADASRIAILIEDDGQSITVSDDGHGIPEDQVETALLRHATSKIADFADLTRLGSRGFRGEALASIASVATVKLTSRPPDAEAAIQLEVRGGQGLGRRPVGAPPGTRIEVRDLFSNVPARRKFLRSPQAEFNAILRVVVSQVLSQPHIGVTLDRVTADGDRRRVLELPADQSLRDRLAQVMGAQVAEHLVPLDLERDGHLATGFVARPIVTRSDTRQQHFFVNGRPVTNRRLGFALRQACAGMIMSGRHPIAAVFLECPPESVDVNVHPTKEEVRFDNEDRVAGLVFRAVQTALSGTDMRPNITLDGSGGAPGKPAPVPYSVLPGAPERSAPMPLRWTEQVPSAPSAPPATQPSLVGVSSTCSDLESPSREAEGEAPPSLAETAGSGAVFDPLLGEGHTIEPLGQIGDTYIVASCGDDMLVIDQHAAHERLMYHRVLERFGKQRRAEQPLLVPLSFDLPATAVSHLDTMIPAFAELGIDMEAFGGQTVLIRTMPTDFGKIDIAAVINDVAADLESGRSGPTAEAVRDRVLTRMSCHAAIKARRRLNRDEMRALIGDLVRARLPHTCPHGRPTMALLTLDQLDRQFKRR